MPKPTPTQLDALRYFAGFPNAGARRMTEATYAACRREGWLEATDEFPYHRTTADGIEIVGEPFNPGTGPVPGYVAGTCGHRVAESEWRAGFRTCERC